MLMKIRGRFLYEVKVKNGTTIGDVRREQAELRNLDENLLRLTYGTEELSDDLLCSTFVENDCELQLNIDDAGCKVHGSLSRAGKVKSQTPKVEKQEKKKKKTGRAKRRLQYTRRFVNVSTVGGRRRGPNANS